MYIGRKNERGTLKKWWLDVIENDMKRNSVIKKTSEIELRIRLKIIGRKAKDNKNKLILSSYLK